MGESALYQTWPGFDTANPPMYQTWFITITIHGTIMGAASFEGPGARGQGPGGRRAGPGCITKSDTWADSPYQNQAKSDTGRIRPFRLNK